MAEAAGVHYNQFTIPEGVSLEGDPYHVGATDNSARWWMEFVTPTTAKVIAQYHHPVWGKYAAITRNTYGMGEVTYIGFMPSDALAEKIMKEAAERANLWGPQQTLHFPTIMRSGVLANGKAVHYVLNYTPAPAQASYGFPSGKDLLSGTAVQKDGTVALPAWGAAIVEEDSPTRP